MGKRFVVKSVMAVLLLSVLVTGVFANGQEEVAAGGDPWPITKNVEIVVPASAGSFTDILARLLAGYWSEMFPKNNFIITNDPSGGYTVAYESGRTADTDGSKILYGTSSLPLTYYFGTYNHFINDDFTLLATVPFISDKAVIAVKADSKFKTLSDMIEYARKNPNTVSTGCGFGNVVYGYARAIEDLTGVTFRKVDGADNNERIGNVLGGSNDFVITGAATAMQYVESGDMRILGIYQNEKSKAYPQIPTFKEEGFEVKVQAPSAYPIVGPLGMDPEMVKFINSTFEGWANAPETKEALARYKGDTAYLNLEESQAVVDEMCAFGELVSSK